MSEISQTSVKLPMLDISQAILDPSSLSSLAEAFKTWGFFHITNHGISKDLFRKLYSLSNDLFSLPSDTKLKLGPLSSAKTYTPHFIASPFFESLRVSGPRFFDSAQTSAHVLFDQHNSEFSEILQEYGSKMAELSKKIVRIALMSLGEGLEKKHYESEFKKCHGYLRVNNYSTPPESLEDQHQEVGLGMHTDMSCVTIVYQDEIGGLQDEKAIFAPEDVVGEGNERIYKPFVCLDYLKFRESNERGKFEKVGFTVRDFAGINHQITKGDS
ncbi:hypothetical protein TB2_040717 [Malus domestica]